MDNFFLQGRFEKAMKFTLTDLGISCALGRGKDEVARNAFSADASGMMRFEDFVWKQTVVFGKIRSDISNKDMRAKALLDIALDELSEKIESLKKEYDTSRLGIVLGSSNTGIDEAFMHIQKWLLTKEKPTEFDFEQIRLGTPAEYLQEKVKFEGPAYVVSTACSSSSKVFYSARALIENDICDAVLVGGVDSLCRFAMNGFYALDALSLQHTNPMSKNREGINLGEGVALFVMEKDKNGIYLAGIGESSDAYHLTSPDPSGAGAIKSMQKALEDAALNACDIDYINLHGTGTLHNDSMETLAVSNLFGKQTLCASTKPLTGHTLGAAGALELALSWLMLKENRIIPHVYDGDYDDTLPDIRLASGKENKVIKTILSNSFAFGGSNASVILRKD